MKLYTIILLWSGLLVATSLHAQKEVSDHISVELLQEAELENLEFLNSAQIEFAPAFFKGGLLFVYSDTEKKRIKKQEDIHFKYRFSAMDDQGFLEEAIDFDSIYQKGEIAGPSCYSTDKEWLFVTRNQTAITQVDERSELNLGIYIYHKVDTAWILKSPFPFNNKKYSICHPAWDEQENRLFYASNMPGGFGELDLYVSELMENGKWTDPVNLGSAINSPYNDCFPFSFNSSYLFYSSDKPDQFGGLNVFASIENDQRWLSPYILPKPINSSADDLNLILDNNGKNIYFTSSRSGGLGKDDLYRIQLDETLFSKHPSYHTVQIIQTQNQSTVSGATVRFFKFETNEAVVEKEADQFSNINFSIDPNSLKGSNPILTNSAGEINIELQNGDYIVQTTKEDYRDTQNLLKIDRPGKYVKIYMDSMECKKIKLIVIDAKSSTKLNNAKISNAHGLKLHSDEDGALFLCFAKDDDMNFRVVKEQFQEQEVELIYSEIKDGMELIIALESIKPLFVPELPVNSGEFTVLDNILYDFDDAKLNAKAKKELERLAEHMLKNKGIVIELSSHTDSRGGEVYNQLLSEKRSTEAKKYMVESGVEDWRIAAIGYGESRLRNKCSDGVECPEEKHAENRRTEVRVITKME